MAEACRAWIAAPPRLDPGKLVFPDGTRATSTMTRARGRARRGPCLVCPVPHGRWRATTFLRGPRAEGLVAPLVLDGAVDGPAFLAWVEQFLAPTLSTGDTVVADNLGSHKVAGVREAIEARGASLLHLPPYSPDPSGRCPEADRTRLRQAQAPAPCRRRPHGGRAGGRHRRRPRPVHRGRMQQPPPPLRLCTVGALTAR